MPFDVPAVLVVGHQTDGKRALVEALMGFQFNHVGGDTKIRWPITLHMKYNPGYAVSVCRLVSDAGPAVASRMSFPKIQEIDALLGVRTLDCSRPDVVVGEKQKLSILYVVSLLKFS
ncbi:unnamed protein product [Musa banksii]